MAIEQIRLPYPVPYYSQLASAELAAAIFDEGMDPRQDARWREYGTENVEEYAYWAPRACGIACVKMVVEALGGSKRTMMEWIRAGLQVGGYVVAPDATGLSSEVGWSHAVLVKLIEVEGLNAEAARVSQAELVDQLQAGNPTIVSISYELGTNRNVTLKGGHLGVLTGADVEDGKPIAFYLHNPSGRTIDLREHARIPGERFGEAYAGRGITVWRG